MTKKIIGSAIAALALATIPGVAHADAVVDFQFTGLAGNLGIGTTYAVLGGSFGNTETATPTVANTWTLTGNVTKDCSFYAGNSGSSSHSINLGTIGVQTSNGVNVGDAFEMTAPAGVVITSGTAGCNTNNTVTITKGNGTQGLLNTAASGFDSNQFTKNLPYSVNATWTGTPNLSAGQAGVGQTLTVSDNEGSDSKTGGAWRSAFGMAVAIPAPNKGLVAGNYSDTLTVTLAAM